jgi:hypothetical protein
MAQLQNKNREQINFLHCFLHKYSFYVPNFSEIISLEMKNFRARFSKKSGEEQGFLWGSYDLYLLYRKFVQGEEVTEEKIFPRNFSSLLDTPSFPAGKNPEKEKINFTCTARYNTSIKPLFLTFFPLLGKLGYLPFKISVEVTGDIFSVACSVPAEQESRRRLEASREESAAEEAEAAVDEPEAAVEEAEAAAEDSEVAAEVKEKKFIQTTGEEGFYREIPGMEEFFSNKAPFWEAEVANEEALADFFAENVLFGEQDVPPGIMPKENRDEQSGDLIAREKKKKAKMGEPSPDPRYYKTYQIFYEHFFPEQPAGKTSSKRK